MSLQESAAIVIRRRELNNRDGRSAMSIEVKVPDLGDGIDSGDVLEILVSEGDTIEKEQGIVELETDKATVEVPSSHTGRITRIHVTTGQSIGPGDILVTLEAAEESSGAPATETADETPPPEAEPEPEPAEEESPSEMRPAPAASAPAAKPPAEPPQRSERPAAARAPAKPAAPSPLPGPARGQHDPIPAGPAIRRFAREVGVDLASVTGTGAHGRITREDVLEAVRGGGRSGGDGRAPAAAPTTAPAEGGDSDAWGPVRRERLSKIRRTIAAQMHKSWETCPRVTNFDDADITELERIRQSSKADYAAQGIKLTSLPFVIKSVAMALRQHPLLNASLDLEGGQTIYKDYVNIGIAVDTERGLVVPSLRQADTMSIPTIARQLSSIADKVRENAFSIEDLRGSTFTISNLGAIGGTYSTPIINVPEVAILLVGRARKLPVVMADDQILPRLMMPLSLAYDHRLVDGAAAARFLNDVIGYLKAPSRLLLAP
jgi:pyruvate/2-oxoglutarate dehydrogenase complex dihydrolipoamide acyltransferase (E2) component